MDQRVVQMLNYFKQAAWPTNTQIMNHEQFLVANRTMRDWRGNDETLIAAFRQYLATGSQPYAMAGAAKILVSTSFSHDDIYDQEGLAEAFKWIERAKTLAPDDNDIILTEASMRLTAGQVEIARKLLDRVRASGFDSFAYRMTEVKYFDDMQEVDKSLEWMDKASALATERRDEIYIWAIKSDTLLEHKRNAEAEQAYLKRLQLDPTDQWGWHNLSIVYQRLKQIDKAKEANERALAIADFGAARQVQEIIRKKIEKATAEAEQKNTPSAATPQKLNINKPLPDIPAAKKPQPAPESPIVKNESRGLFGFFRRKKS